MLRNLQSDPTKRLFRRVDAGETQTPGGDQSISSGRTRYLGAHSLQVVGSMDVDGTIFVNGSLQGAGGSIIWSGTFSLTGTQTVSGSGQIIVGSMTLDTGGVYGGRIVAPTALLLSTPQVVCSNNLTVGGGATISANLGVGGDSTFQGLIINTGMTASASAANVYADPSTFRLYRFTSASRFKLDQQPLDVAPTLLDVRMDHWVDRGSAERYAELMNAPRPFTEIQQSEWDAPNTLRRIPGVIAEKVAEAGGEAFIVRNADGEVDSFDSLNFALARTQILADENRELREQIAELAKQVAKLLKK